MATPRPRDPTVWGFRYAWGMGFACSLSSDLVSVVCRWRPGIRYTRLISSIKLLLSWISSRLSLFACPHERFSFHSPFIKGHHLPHSRPPQPYRSPKMSAMLAFTVWATLWAALMVWGFVLGLVVWTSLVNFWFELGSGVLGVCGFGFESRSFGFWVMMG